ncbi:MAG: xanthine dehydrogenase family protein subunit M [Anaerolineaceae bacterium]|nr:xanthine dehydrogenase family protein subunit M [Anaerolineaceae bacterium]
MSIKTHSVLPQFEYIKPVTLSEASQFLADHIGTARPFLGGTDTFVRMRDGIWTDKFLLDVKGLPGTEQLSFSLESGLTIGAALSMNQVQAHAEVRSHYPLLVEAINSVASYQLRSRATIVGNICNGSPAGDTIGACMLYNASLKIHGLDGIRHEALRTFFTGPGKVKLNPGDIVISIELPVPPEGFCGTYRKLGRNKKGDLAIIGVTVGAWPDQTTTSGYRFELALASVAPTPLIVPEVEEILKEQEINPQRLKLAAVAAMQASRPIDDIRSSAQYRKMMVRNLSQQALKAVWKSIELS